MLGQEHKRLALSQGVLEWDGPKVPKRRFSQFTPSPGKSRIWKARETAENGRLSQKAADFGFGKKGVFWKRGLFRKVHSLEILENLEILEILENRQTLETKENRTIF